MSTRITLDLSGAEWKLWRDADAEWRDDKLHLPPVDVGTLPARLPTGGWETLDRSGIDVTVPGTVEAHCWDEIGDYQGVSWWWRTFELPEDAADRRLILHFESVRLRAEVFVNQRLVGYDVVGDTPFDIDLSGHVLPGRNVLAVRVTDPCGNFSWEDFDAMQWGAYKVPPSHGFGGIAGRVSLNITDPLHVADVFVRNKPQITEVDVDVAVRNDTGESMRRDVALRIFPVDRPEEIVCEHIERDAELPPGESRLFRAMGAPDVAVWQLDDPRLYVCRVEIAGGDAAEVRFGFRWFSPELIDNRAIFRLNGKRIVLRSAISWSFWPTTGSVPSDELARRHIDAAKRLGLNMLHFHRAMGNPRVLEIADQQGLLYYQEPGGFYCRGGDKFCYAIAREQWLRMVRRDRNHPAMVIYNQINENSWPPHGRHEKALAETHAIDPTRSYTYTSGWNKEAVPDATKLHMRPYDDRQHVVGWFDFHHAAGPGCYCDEFYAGPEEYRLRTTNAGEIVFWGEEGAIGTPPRLQKIHETLDGQPNGWDGADYRRWYAAYAEFFERKGWQAWFPTIDDMTRSCGNIAYYYQGRTIENIRLGNCTDGYVVNGWEAQKQENHSGVVDCYRQFKGDPEILARYNRPACVAVKLRQKVMQSPARIIADFYLINEVDVCGPHTLHAWLESTDGRRLWETTCDVSVTGGDTFGELLVEGIEISIDGPGRFRMRAELRAGEDVRADGDDEVFVVDRKSQELPTRIAHLGTGSIASEFLQREREIDVRPLDTGDAAPVILVEGFDPLPRETVPSECLRPTEGSFSGLTGRYYRGRSFDTCFTMRTDPVLDFDWQDGTAIEEIGPRDWSVRWEGRLRAPETGRYTLYLTHDDGARLWLDDNLLIDEWTVYETWAAGREPTRIVQAIELEAGREYSLRIEYFQTAGPAKLRLQWTTPSAAADAATQVQAVLQQVENGATAVVITDAEPWARALSERGLLQYRGWLQGGLYWLGSNFIVREHPLFANLPTNQAMNWEYQALARYEAARTGLLIDGEESVVAMVSGHRPAIATAVGVVRHGAGQIVLSTLDLCRVLGDGPGPADVARKVLCNYIAAGVR